MLSDPKTKSIHKPETADFRHFPALDGIRGVAVLCVMFYHLEYLAPGLRMIVKGGFLGVDVFFVLSGFLITSILIKEREEKGCISLGGFYLRRTLRLVPAFWLFLLVLYLAGETLLPRAEAALIYSENNFLFSFIYLMNWHRAFGAETGNLNHTWSLAIEEQFYVIWSLILYWAFSGRWTRRQLAAGTAFLILVLILQRAIRTMAGTSIDVLYYSTDTRIDAILIGCLTSMIYCWKLFPNRLWVGAAFDRLFMAAVITAVSIFVLFGYEDRFLYYGPISLFSISIAVAILWVITREKSIIHSCLEYHSLRWLGKISYGLYLWHFMFYEFAKSQFEDNLARIFVGMGLSIGVSALSFYLVESPLLGLKNLRHRSDTALRKPSPVPESA